jgi:hypothetical protein
MLKNAKTISQQCRILLLSICTSAGFNCQASENDPARGHIEAVLTSVSQYGYYDEAIDENGEAISDRGRGSFALDVQGEFTPSSEDTFHALVSFARGNGLKNTGGVSVAANADDLEDDVKNINGKNRDYLLEAWYRRQLLDSQAVSVAVTGGLINATHYLDHNRVANDEITQFMNEVFVTRFFLPSYDTGIAIQTKGEKWHVDMTWMRTQTDSNKNGGVDYDFFGIDLGYIAELPFGEGHYHLVGLTTSNDFEDRNKADRHASIHGLSLSMDQTIGDGFAIFMRTGWSNEDASELVHDALYSGGFQVDGHRFSVPKLVAGVGYAYLDGAGSQPGDIRHTRVFETYARYPLTQFSDISADVQWISDEVRDAQNPQLWAIGARLNLYF